jgi:hypothetical protein
MRARGMQHDAIEAALLATNLQQCNPPLEDEEFERSRAASRATNQVLQMTCAAR